MHLVSHPYGHKGNYKSDLAWPVQLTCLLLPFYFVYRYTIILFLFLLLIAFFRLYFYQSTIKMFLLKYMTMD